MPKSSKIKKYKAMTFRIPLPLYRQLIAGVAKMNANGAGLSVSGYMRLLITDGLSREGHE